MEWGGRSKHSRYQSVLDFLNQESHFKRGFNLLVKLNKRQARLDFARNISKRTCTDEANNNGKRIVKQEKNNS